MKIFVETDKGEQRFCDFIIVYVANTPYKIYDKDSKICIEPMEKEDE